MIFTSRSSSFVILLIIWFSTHLVVVVFFLRLTLLSASRPVWTTSVRCMKVGQHGYKRYIASEQTKMKTRRAVKALVSNIEEVSQSPYNKNLYKREFLVRSSEIAEGMPRPPRHPSCYGNCNRSFVSHTVSLSSWRPAMGWHFRNGCTKNILSVSWSRSGIRAFIAEPGLFCFGCLARSTVDHLRSSFYSEQERPIGEKGPFSIRSCSVMGCGKYS